MIFRACACGVMLALARMSDASSSAQPIIIETLFDNPPGRARASENTKAVNPQAAAVIADKPASFLLKSFPLANGASAGFDMTPANLFGPETRVTLIGDAGTTSAAALPETKAWYGRDITGGKRSLLLVTRTDGTMGAMVTGDDTSSDTVVMPDESGQVYTVTGTDLLDRDMCSVGDLVPDSALSGITSRDGGSTSFDAAELDSGTRQVDLMLDVSYVTYQKLSSNQTRVNDYVTQLMAAVGSIYRRDLNVEFRISNLYIWTTPDTFSSNKGADNVLDTGDQLSAYQNFVIQNRAGVSRDLAHLVNYNTGLGGIAYVGALCEPSYGVGVSNVHAELNFPADANKYYWDTMVVAHEMGHNFGSQHTHSMEPPVDCCYVGGDSKCSTAKPTVGTIMSYCHLGGGGIAMNFHQRSIDAMRAEVDGSPCLSSYTATAKATILGRDGEVIPAGQAPAIMNDGTVVAVTDVGSAPVTQNFTLTNVGSQELVLNGAVQLSGSRNLAISAQPSVSTLTPGASTTFAVTFNPSVEGLHNAQLSLITNDPAMPTYAFAVAGNAVRRAAQQAFHYNGNAAIPDNSPAGVTVTIPVTGVNGPVMDVDFAIEGSQCSDARYVGLQHAYVGDLTLILESPSGKQVKIMNRPGAGSWGSTGDNFCGTIFNDEAGGASIQTIGNTGPFSGTFAPAEPLSAFRGEVAAGNWKLKVIDSTSGGSGILRSASLKVTGTQQLANAGVSDWMSY